ncbi:MAG: HlyC/CorC family transporter [Magnetococcales bacterium]|nr:HlyC/CorC family transporter [Magnetococcales bacterium]
MDIQPNLALDPNYIELVVRILFQVVLLVSSAFFSGSETALFSLSRLDLQKLRNTRHPRSEKIHELLDEPRRLIISILCGNELVNIASSANMAAILITFFGEADTTWINIVVMVPLLLLIGEVTPKTFAVTFPVKFASNLSVRLLPRWIVMITPLRTGVRIIADRITTWIGGEAIKKNNILHPDEFRTLVDESAAFGIIDAVERVLIDNALKASETEIVTIMTPRTQIKFLDGDLPLEQLVKEFRRLKHSRVPIIKKYRDNVMGFLRAEDLLQVKQRGARISELNLSDLIKPAHFVPPTLMVDEMFEYFQSHNTNIAIILGEYGGVSGIVTMHDVLTFMFGEISGYIDEPKHVVSNSENAILVPGDMRLSDFNKRTRFSITDPTMTTIGGYVFRLLETLPKAGDSVVFNENRFTVLEMEKLRIKTIKISPLNTPSPATETRPPMLSHQPEVDGPTMKSDEVFLTDQEELGDDLDAAEDLPDSQGKAAAPQADGPTDQSRKTDVTNKGA